MFVSGNARGVAGGVCPVDVNKKVPVANVPTGADQTFMLVTVAAAAPAVAPTAINLGWIDTTNAKFYVSKATGVVGDWMLMN